MYSSLVDRTRTRPRSIQFLPIRALPALPALVARAETFSSSGLAARQAAGQREADQRAVSADSEKAILAVTNLNVATRVVAKLSVQLQSNLPLANFLLASRQQWLLLPPPLLKLLRTEVQQPRLPYP